VDVYRVLLVAGALVIACASAEARPVWKTYPTPLPPQVHLAKVRPAWIGPVWRRVVVPASVAATDIPPAIETTAVAEPPVANQPAPVSWRQVFTAPLAEQAVVAVEPRPAPPFVGATAPEPAPLIAKPAPASPPAPIVVAEKAPAPPPAPPAALESSSPKTPWLDYISAFVMAIVLGGVIFFFSRDRKRTV
jgi:hypothetical protein